MTRSRASRLAVAAGILAVAVGLSGCSLPGATSTDAAPRPGAAPTTITGTWVYRSADTSEVIHLRQGTKGLVQGSGSSHKTVKGKVYKSAIDVHDGRVRRGAVTLTLYVTQLNWGSGLSVVEYLRCSAASRALHCRMDLPLYKIASVKQDFART